jgi:hypothetical protein
MLGADTKKKEHHCGAPLLVVRPLAPPRPAEPRPAMPRRASPCRAAPSQGTQIGTENRTTRRTEKMGPTLDRRIADTLASDKHEAADLADIIREATSVLGSIEAEQAHAAQQALDPAVADFATQKSRADTAALMASRLRNALPRLQVLLDVELKSEKLAKWNADLADLKVVRDDLAKQLRERYAACATEIIQLFDQVAYVDRQVDALNSRAHACSGASQMRTVEATARGVDHIAGNTKSILDLTRLPVFGLGSGEAGLVWPRPTVPLALAVAAAMPTAPPPDPQLLAEVEAEGGFEAGGLRRVLAKRKQQEADEWEKRGREQERQRELARAEEAARLHTAAVERRQQGA